MCADHQLLPSALASPSDGAAARGGQPQRKLEIEAAFVTPGEIETRLRSGQMLLGEIHFGAGTREVSGRHPLVRVAMPELNAPPLIEAWFSDLPVDYRHTGKIHLARNEDVLFGCVDLGESGPEEFEALVHRSYDEILALLENEGYPHLLRMWNYFPSINAPLGDLDRYQGFCRGRFDALDKHYAGQFDQRLPAASAVGAQQGPMAIYFIAAKNSGKHRENPRQMSAYRYPPQYGPRSPSFARATLKRWSDADYLYISGTASIVGHESLHRGDPGAQLEETLENIRALIEASSSDDRLEFRSLESLTHVKVYIRQPAHYELIRRRLEAALGGHASVMYLHADICRAELLLEIEAIARSG